MVRVAAVGDLHCRRENAHAIGEGLSHAPSEADILLLAGDLTAYGDQDQAHALADALKGIHIPRLAVLGNHDCHKGQAHKITRILAASGIVVLDGETWHGKLNGHTVGVAGVKGFAGGFGRAVLTPFGETALKEFVEESIREAQKLEIALHQVNADVTIALLHYSPIRDTVEGELPELFPFLGCSRLAEPLNKRNVQLVVHGHAHHGTERGRTETGIPVRNVALPLLESYYTVYSVAG